MRQMTVAAVAVVLLGLVASAQAQDKGNPSGTWKWTITFNDQTREQTLVLKTEGDKLTGHMVGRDNQENPITDASFKDGQVSFTVTTERNGQKFTSKYQGKLEGDTIKGTRESQRDGQTQTRDWEAKRA